MKTRIIQTRFWDDEFICETDIYTQHLYIYLLTSQYINISGYFQLSPKKIQFECKLTENQFEQARQNLESAGKVFFRDGWVHVPNARKNNNYLSKEQNQKAYENEISRVPKDTMSLLTQYCVTTDAVHINNNPKSNPKPKPKPMLEKEDLKEIAKQLSLSEKDVQAGYEEMLDYIASKGKVYNDYKATLRNWMRRKITDGKIKVEEVILL